MTKDIDGKTYSRHDQLINTCTNDVDNALRKCREALAKECGMTLEEGMVAAFRNTVGFLEALKRAFADKVDLSTGRSG